MGQLTGTDAADAALLVGIGAVWSGDLSFFTATWTTALDNPFLPLALPC